MPEADAPRFASHLGERSTRTAIVIAADPLALYDAFMDPAKLIAWLPPAGMTGRLHGFDGRAGGGYSMSLFYGDEETRFRGKTAEREDRIDVRFVRLEPGRLILETGTFVSDDPALQGTMTMTVTFMPVAGGTEVAMRFDDLPPGLAPADNEAGARISLGQLARRFG